jgi:hypothetical protein
MRKTLITVSLIGIAAVCLCDAALADPKDNKPLDTPPMVMASGGDVTSTLDDYSGYQNVTGYWIEAPSTAHVSLTVSAEGMETGEWVGIQFLYVDQETGDMEVQLVPVVEWDVDGSDGTGTIEFDAVRAETGGPGSGVYGNWFVVAHCNDTDQTGFDVFYTYTMTYSGVK